MVVARRLRFLGIEPVAMVEARTADAVPVVPAPEILSLQTLRFDAVLDAHVRHVEAAAAGGARAQVPFALRLAAQRSRLASEGRVEEAGFRKGLAAVGDVDAERPADADAEFPHRGPVVQQREHLLDRRCREVEPGRRRLVPQRRDRTADEVAPQIRQCASADRAIPGSTTASSSVAAMISPRAAIDGGVHRGVLAVDGLVDVAQLDRIARREGLHHCRRVIGRMVVDDQHFPWTAGPDAGERREGLGEAPGPVVGADDDRVSHRMSLAP